ncbi:DUF3558 domain-containing protein [Rhodococcus sp. HNM0569]|uniref:DUF3558 domain-containing protein n=1 Tax=Rhodococcus sp. HNM0569 TaxID=2716340 RepID=UPI00146B4C60|nr:DUF3558 domain-containing protein [Rhodococcus sp. HNM0569]NLU82742.1 DUF3558 domain-containing protein [Rhodococcus sp. HNM0569]
MTGGGTRRHGIRLVVCGAVVALAATLGGCGRTITGTPTVAGSAGGDRYTDLLEECDAVADQQIAEVIGADQVLRGFFGAICRWDSIGAGAAAKVTFDWFETGSLDTEEQTNTRLGYTVSDTTVQGRRALVLTQPADPASCGITLGSPSDGVVGWWVQYKGASPVDPCDAVVKLAELTVDVSN